jgi:lipopolysaccharide cholinephosphotransferase
MSTQKTDQKKLHGAILKVARYFDDFCKTHDIEYSLMGGTALGSRRHNGFIPWDDDFDVFMTLSNYNKLLGVLPELNKEEYYFQKEGTEEWPLYFSKIRLNGTTYLESEDIGRAMHNGVFIDVMCLSNLSNYKIIRYLQYLVAKSLSASALKKRGYTSRSITKKVFIIVCRMIYTLPIKRFALRFVRGQKRVESKYKGHFFGRAPFKKSVFPSKWFQKMQRVQFEEYSFSAIQELDEYLLLRFGAKYLEIPSQKVRDAYPSHLHYLDLGSFNDN